MQVVGVDGCPGGWLAIEHDVEAGTLTARVYLTFLDLLNSYPGASTIGVDIPIGLAQGEPRCCDRAARRILGPRRSSVFPAPDRCLLHCESYAEALERSRALYGKGISRQAFAIFPKVAEVDRLMTPEIQQRVVEVHPEVAFRAMAGGQPMRYRKGRAEGFLERRALLIEQFAAELIPERQPARKLAPPARPDDVLDAIAAAWTARRYAEGRAVRLPANPPLDSRGLRMEIVY